MGGSGCPENQKIFFDDGGKQKFIDCKVSDGDPADKDNTALDAKLAEEKQEHGDLEIMDMVDSYRKLPLKLRLFYRRLAESYNYDFVMKIDDDTYVNVDRVLKLLQDDKVPLENTWYGHMRCNWERVTNNESKWHDDEYTAGRYPCFGGGGGNLLTHGLADWVGVNAPLLKDYQGEDISMGIWLAARFPDIIT